MRLLNALLIVLALVSSALASTVPPSAVRAMQALQILQHHVDANAASGGVPDFSRPAIADLFRLAFDVDALADMPPPQASDAALLLAWSYGANRTSKAMLHGVKPAVDPDAGATARHVGLDEDHSAVMADFVIRLNARTATAYQRFLEGLGADQHKPIRAAHTAREKSDAAAMIEDFLASVGSTVKPVNARRVTAALRDTRDVWAGFIAPEARERIVGLVAQGMRQMTDAEARANLATFSSALAAAK